MKNEPIELKPTEAVNDVSELVLDDDELDQLAKFLDALLEADLANPNRAGSPK